ncbi:MULTISPECIES: hypothetical protein [unclassified Streptomyces]|uniref:hypothetical protein n=1 Tax=unclassified Streptomyces TaxID=2593676 RepID=UPI00093B7946|nr:hypothetical protein [Streptomyces sp. TSRI0281]OKI35016.1 hypothetical protein A6A29_16470 [Streptomyces sp. TSRI0281]
MRRKIRHTIPGHTIDDVSDALRELVVDDRATYSEVLIVKEIGQPDAVRESVLSGVHVRAFIRIQLQESMRLVQQHEPSADSVITLSCDRPTKANRYRTQTCTYTKVC